MTPAMLALEVRPFFTRFAAGTPFLARAHLCPLSLQSAFGIWFLHRRRVSFVGLLKVLAVMLLTYVFWFKVGPAMSAEA